MIESDPVYRSEVAGDIKSAQLATPRERLDQIERFATSFDGGPATEPPEVVTLRRLLRGLEAMGDWRRRHHLVFAGIILEQLRPDPEWEECVVDLLAKLHVKLRP